jgi:DNA polymerase-3 subunit beta
MLSVRGGAAPIAAALVLATLPATERKIKNLPQLGAVRLTGDGERLCIAAATFNALLTTVIEVEADGDAALPASRLADLVGRFPADDEVTITADDKGAMVVSGRARFRLPVIPIGSLPEPLALGEVIGTVEIEASAARDLFSRPLFAVSTEETRHYLNGIFLHNVGENLVAVGGDGHRLALTRTAARTPLSLDQSLIVQREIVKVITRLLSAVGGNVVVRRTERLFAIDGESFSLITRLLDATFPSYQCMVSDPSRPQASVTVSRASLGQSLARFRVTADPLVRTHLIKLHWDADGLHLATPDGSTESLAAEIQGEASTAIQLRYLLDLVGALRGDSIRFATTSEPGRVVAVSDPDDPALAAFQMPVVW